LTRELPVIGNGDVNFTTSIFVDNAALDHGSGRELDDEACYRD